MQNLLSGKGKPSRFFYAVNKFTVEKGFIKGMMNNIGTQLYKWVGKLQIRLMEVVP